MKTDRHKSQLVPNLRFPGFEGEWREAKLGESCRILMCKRILAAQTNPDGGVPFYKIGTVGGVADAYISQQLFESYRAKYNYPKKGEILITCAGTVGKSYIFNGEDSYFQDSNIVWVDNPTELIQNSFLFYLLSIKNWGKLNSTTITRIYNDNLKALDIVYPGQAEQQKIISLLTLIDSRLSTQNKIIEQLESLIKGLCVYIYRLQDKRSFRVAELGCRYNAILLSKEDLSDEGNECIIYGELFTKYGCVIDKIQSKTKKSCNAGSLSKGHDILFPASTTVDAVSLIAPSALNDKDIILGGDMFGITINKEFNNEAISYIINYVYKYKLAKYAQGSTIVHIYYDDIKNVEIFLPNKHAQDSLAGIMRCLSARIETEKNILLKFKMQKEYFLQNLFI